MIRSNAVCIGPFDSGVIPRNRRPGSFVLHEVNVPPPTAAEAGVRSQPGGTEGAAPYIQGLVEDHITAGCGVSPPLYCPTRAQMAVFVWKGQHGEQAPPPCTPPGTFGDVPCPGGFAVDFVEGIYAEGITAGCGNGNYCPNASITNAQIAVFLVKAFSIPYLP